MRRLLHTLLLPMLVGLALLAPVSVAVAADDLPADTVQLATEATDEEPAGLEPGGANDPDNANAPEDYEPNFLWGAAVGLAVLAVGGLGVLGGLYWLMVRRREAAAEG